MKSIATQKIVKKIAWEERMTEKEVFDIVKSPFEFLIEIMRSRDKIKLDYKSVRIKYFGTFFCSEGRRRFLSKLSSKLKDKEDGKEQ